MTIVMLLLVAWNLLAIWLSLNGAFDRESGNDAAGAGMSRAFGELFAIAGAVFVGVLALLYLVIRHDGVRIALLCLLVLPSLIVAAAM